MRIVSLLLACYIVVLVLVPCHDELPADKMVASVLEQPTTDQHHHMEDACSPFCTCTCCTTPVAQQQHTITLCCQVEQNRLTADLHTAAPRTGSASIWQPPKLS